MYKLISSNKSFSEASSKFNEMLKIKIKHNFHCTFQDDSIIDYYADSMLGGAKIKMSIPANSFFRGPFNNDVRISKIEFTLDLNKGFLSWLDIWKKIDDFIMEQMIDYVEILNLNIFEQDNLFYDRKQIFIEPYLHSL